MTNKPLPWPPRPDVVHDPTAEICVCDDCELPRFEAWADKIDAESANAGVGFVSIVFMFIIIAILMVILL